MAMRSLGVTFLFALSVPVSGFAKEKPRITIQVVNSEASERQYTYTTPGRKGTAQTNCTTNGTTNGTINDYGVGPIQTRSSGNANTNCITTTTAATPPQTHIASLAVIGVTALMPDGSRVMLVCEYGVDHCNYLAPGKYEAEIHGTSLEVYVPDLAGKLRKVKYKATVTERAAIAHSSSQPQPDAFASPAPVSRSAESAPTAQSIATLIEQAADGDANAQYYLGRAYETGQGVSQDYAQDAIWFRKAAEQGFADAQAELGADYELGQGAPQDFAEAYFWLDLAAAGTPITVKPEDLAKARDLETKARDQAASLLTPEVRLRVQARVQQWLEEHKSIEVLRQQAATGDATAQCKLGEMYEFGEGVTQDYEQAAVWFRKAADQGNASAQEYLGALYDIGQGVPLDYAQAVLWFRKAADQGFADALYSLGLAYQQGKGVLQDYAQAAIWYRKAAEQGVAEAQLNLSVLYAHGKGIPQDYGEAYFWSDLAANGNLSATDAAIATKDVDQNASHLSPAELSSVQERARKWFEVHPAKPQ